MGAEQGTGKSAPCPACGMANEPGAPRCTSCGLLIGKRRRRRGVVAESDTPFAAEIAIHNLPALRAYRLAILGILPGVGLIAGPVACVLGAIARRRGKRDPQFTATGPALAAVILGGLSGAANWTGFALMFLGLRRLGWF